MSATIEAGHFKSGTQLGFME